jgi:proteasome lid subunit RPN8/RPN11
MRQVLDSVVTHARRTAPRECCGILLARPDDPPTVSCALWVENAEKDHPETRYVLGHRAHMRAVEMETSGVAGIVGYYHSHLNGGPEPSALDADLAVEGKTNLILGVGGGIPRHSAWRFEGGGFVQEPLEVVGEVIGEGMATDAEAT